MLIRTIYCAAGLVRYQLLFLTISIVMLAPVFQARAGSQEYDGSMRWFPGAFGAKDILGMAQRPDGTIVTVVSPGSWVVLFDPYRQNMELAGSIVPRLVGDNATNFVIAGGLRIPLLFDDTSHLWAGLSGATQKGDRNKGYLVSYQRTGDSYSNSIPPVAVGDESVACMVWDAEQQAVYAMTRPGGRLIRHLPGQNGVSVLAAIPDYQGCPLIQLADGKLYTLDGHGRIHCISRQSRGSQKIDPILVIDLETNAAPSGVTQPGWLTSTRDGRTAAGVWGAPGQIFAFNPDKAGFPKITFAAASIPPGFPGDDGISAPLCMGADDMLYYVASENGFNLMSRFDPRTGRVETIGRLACGTKIINSRKIRAMAADGDGRIWFAMCDRLGGGGLCAAPVLPEAFPWTNSDRRYTCRKVRAGAISIDGVPDEPEWRKAQVADHFSTAGMLPQPALYATVSRLLWTDTHLIVAHECATDGIRTDITRRDMIIWEGEVAEMMLCPMGAEAPYYEINVNPVNALYDSRVQDYNYTAQAAFAGLWATNWNAAIQSATRVYTNAGGTVTGWSVEMAIPFKDLDANRHNPPRHGTLWAFNLFRVAKQADGVIEWSAWTSTHADFHRPFDFPGLLFKD